MPATKVILIVQESIASFKAPEAFYMYRRLRAEDIVERVSAGHRLKGSLNRQAI